MHARCAHYDFIHRVVHLAYLYTSWLWNVSSHHHMIMSYFLCMTAVAVILLVSSRFILKLMVQFKYK